MHPTCYYVLDLLCVTVKSILSFVDDPWLMNLNTHTNTHTPMLEPTSNAKVSAFQGAEVPTNR